MTQLHSRVKIYLHINFCSNQGTGVELILKNITKDNNVLKKGLNLNQFVYIYIYVEVYVNLDIECSMPLWQSKV